MNFAKVKDTVVRILKTALETFLVAVPLTASGLLDLSDAGVAIGVTAALVAVQNLFVSATSAVGRALSTFWQVFVGTWSSQGFAASSEALSTSAIAAVSAGLVTYAINIRVTIK